MLTVSSKMKIKTLRQLQREEIIKKYKKIYVDVTKNRASWATIKSKYGYATEHSASVVYYTE